MILNDLNDLVSVAQNENLGSYFYFQEVGVWSHELVLALRTFAFALREAQEFLAMSE